MKNLMKNIKKSWGCYKMNNYDKLIKCLYNCPSNNTCEYYAKIERDKTCVWTDIIQEDIKKIGTGEVLTFSVLEQILNNEVKK